MKYVIVILGGAADEPHPELDGQTPLQRAQAPALARLAEAGRLGEVQLIPADAHPAVAPGPTTALMSLLGYKPELRDPGHAPLHALGAGVPIAEGDWCFELSLLSVIDGLVQPTRALNIPEGEAEALIRGLLAKLDMPGAVVHPGQSLRPGSPAHLLIDPQSSGTDRDWSEVVTQRPDDIAGSPLRKAMPVGGPAGERLARFIETLAQHLADHELNTARLEMGEPAITHLWPWGQGTLPPGGKPVKPWTKRFGKSAAVLSPDPAVRGVAKLVGIDTLDPRQTAPAQDEDVPPADTRTQLAQLGAQAVASIAQYDLTVIHIDAIRQASLDAGPREKVGAIELACAHVVDAVDRALQAIGQPHRLLVTPLHTTHLASGRETPAPVPFLIAGHKFTNVVARPLTEPAAAQADLKVAFGHELMEYFLRSGVR